ncbi:myeloid cell surface antigen CD33-like [Echinops telfairi]|uniref:Myeloid cell surface antigen CD33-like n=1 Tax=Echinops telfairi TaxID=9371 RepID=A0ABM1VKL7_ECHTE|nr:myeloid cell surface antigen CD33-like [Echinops telfairi]
MFLLLLLLLPPLPLLGQRSWAPDPGFNLQIPKSVTVQEGLCVAVPCVVSYPRVEWNQSTPALAYWFQDGSNIYTDAPVATNDPERKVQEETRDRFHLTGDPRRNDCSLDITDARMTDVGSYFFKITRGTYVKFSYKYNPLHVNVTALTETPKIHIQGTLEAGRPKNITCKAPWACKRGKPPIFSWSGVAVTALGPMDPHSSILTLTPEPAHNDTTLTCRVTLPGAGVTTESTIQLIVSWKPSPWSGVVKGVAWGVGIATLLALCLCLVFFVRKVHKKKSAEKAAHTNDVHPALGTSSQGHLYESRSGSPTDHPSPAAAAPASKEEQELHYASVTFQEPQSWSSQHVKAQETPNTTEYSEIRLAK